ncbi:hypothetical protein JR338_02825 [Chloroflexota bacterium]|nr:hypothetical protein JR338_02825 [Chloroflexota bacterium]
MKKTTLITTLLVLIALITACTPQAQATEEAAILTVNEASYTQSGLEALGTTSVDYTGKDGVVTTYEGVLLSALLSDAGAASGTEVTFTAADGYEASITVEELMACANCIVGFDEGSLRTVMPDMSGKLNVKDLVSITVQ